MLYAVRLTCFLLLSLSIHWLVLQINFSRPAVLSTLQPQGVGFVSRPAAHFVSVSASRKNSEQQVTAVNRIKELQAVSTKEVVSSSAQVRSLPNKIAVKPEINTKTIPPDIKSGTVLRASGSSPQISELKEVETPAVESAAQVKMSPQSVAPSELATEGLPPSSSIESTMGIAAAEATNGPESPTGVKAYQKALPRYDLNPPPEYPELPWRRGQQGTVLLEVLVLADGRVGDIDIASSSGYKILDRAAQKAVKYWQFSAATSFGATVESRVFIPVDFILE